MIKKEYCGKFAREAREAREAKEVIFKVHNLVKMFKIRLKMAKNRNMFIPLCRFASDASDASHASHASDASHALNGIIYNNNNEKL